VCGYVVIAAGIAFLLYEGDATGAMLALTGWFLVLSANALRDRVRLDELVGGHTVEDAMERNPITVSPSLTVDTFAAQLLAGDGALTAVPVEQDDRVVGLLGARQIRGLRRAEWTTKRVEQVMVRPPRLSFLAAGDSLKGALERLHRGGLDGLPVLEDGRLIGVLTRRGVGLFVRARQQAQGSTTKDSGSPPTDAAGPGGGADGGAGPSS
jgi:CBS domain-containing protein